MTKKTNAKDISKWLESKIEEHLIEIQVEVGLDLDRPFRIELELEYDGNRTNITQNAYNTKK